LNLYLQSMFEFLMKDNWLYSLIHYSHEEKLRIAWLNFEFHHEFEYLNYPALKPSGFES
jgi:hypothetical protein